MIILLPREYIASFKQCLKIKGNIAGLLLLPLVFLFSFIIFFVLNYYGLSQEPSGGGNPFISSIPLIVCTVILLPFVATGETMLFQKYPIDKWGKISIVPSSMIFGILHGLLTGSGYTIIMTGFIGCIFCIFYLYKGYEFVVSMHFSYDLGLITLLLLSMII